MADSSNSFTKFVPGFDFLQGLVKNAGAALPGIGQWVAPTLNPEELEKRIEELRTVQFWLEQNARMLGATIQALEVQRMTLSTLQSMNVPLAELRETLKAAMPPVAAPAPQPVDEEPEADDDNETAAEAPDKPASKAAAIPAVDPMQWWSALSQQFTQLATNAMKEQATDAAKVLAGNLVKQSFDAAGETLRKAAAVPGTIAKKAVAKRAPAPAGKTTRQATGKTPTAAKKGAAKRAPAARKR